MRFWDKVVQFYSFFTYFIHNKNNLTMDLEMELQNVLALSISLLMVLWAVRIGYTYKKLTQINAAQESDHVSIRITSFQMENGELNIILVIAGLFFTKFRSKVCIYVCYCHNGVPLIYVMRVCLVYIS